MILSTTIAVQQIHRLSNWYRLSTSFISHATTLGVGRKPVTADIPSQYMWDFRTTKRHLDTFFSQYSVFPCQYHSTSAPWKQVCLYNRHTSHTSSPSSVICQTTGPKPLPKRFLHIVRSRASSFNWQYPLLSLRSSSSFLRLLPRLRVTSICPFIFPSIICCRRQFLRKMWPIQLAFRFLISCRIFLWSLTLSNTSSFLTWSVQLIYRS